MKANIINMKIAALVGAQCKKQVREQSHFKKKDEETVARWKVRGEEQPKVTDKYRPKQVRDSLPPYLLRQI